MPKIKPFVSVAQEQLMDDIKGLLSLTDGTPTLYIDIKQVGQIIGLSDYKTIKLWLQDVPATLVSDHKKKWHIREVAKKLERSRV